MAFKTGYLADPARVQGGERFGNNNTILSVERGGWESVNVGRFAQFKNNKLVNFDGTASPVIAGVVLRQVTNSVESGAVISADLFDHVEYVRHGLVTVDVAPGAVQPNLLADVYISNKGDASDGLVTNDNTQVPAHCEFIRTTGNGAWLVRQKDIPFIPAP